MANNNEQTILEFEVQVSNIMKDLRERVKSLYDVYTTDTKLEKYKLPPYDLLLKDVKLRYKTSSLLIESLDNINNVKLRITIVSRNLNDMRTVRITSVSNYTLVGNFRNNLKKYCEELNEYRFDLMDLQKNTNNKIRLLDSMSYVE